MGDTSTKPRVDRSHEFTNMVYIGKGRNGSVFAATRKADGKKVALKYVPTAHFMLRKTSNGSRIPNEIYWLRSLSGMPGVNQMVDNFSTPGGLCIVLERPGKFMNLQEFVDRRHKHGLPEAMAKVLFRQCVETLQRLHNAKVLHGDIKPNNLVVDLETNQILVVDLGHADRITDDVINTYRGAPICKPPEYILARKFRALPLSIWTLGITLYYITHGRYPFYSDPQILKGSLNCRLGLSFELKCLIRAMLEPHASKRPDFDAILRHRWMRSTSGSEKMPGSVCTYV